MKTAIYIEDGATQLVLTPENEWEKHAINCIQKGEQTIEVRTANFYECRGGWFRTDQNGSESLILRTRMKPPMSSDDFAIEA